MKQLILSILFFSSLYADKSIEWRFNASNIDGTKYISDTPLAKGTFFKSPRIENNTLILNEDNYLVLDSIPTSILDPQSMSLEFIIKLQPRTQGGGGIFGYFNNGDTKDGFAIGRWNNELYLTYFGANSNATNKTKVTPKANEWLHIITTMSSQQLRIYINNELICDEKINTETIFPKQGLFTIGNYFNNADQKTYNMKGAIHLAKIYRNELNPKTVKKKFREAKALIDTNFLATTQTQNAEKPTETKVLTPTQAPAEVVKEKADKPIVKEENNNQAILRPEKSQKRVYQYLSMIFFYFGVSLALMDQLQKRGYKNIQLGAAFLTPIALILISLTPKLKFAEEF